ncbi:hypothetical protein K7432_013418 [Basidiobolus ranarum]|uniref:F-box domain-containing protein n=1 Tax=Basidiobolus ranarum TaxID=34480 RepID=A0ABR2WJB0_9FUNG
MSKNSVLPLEVLKLTFEYLTLSPASLVNCCLVNSVWSKVSLAVLWKNPLPQTEEASQKFIQYVYEHEVGDAHLDLVRVIGSRFFCDLYDELYKFSNLQSLNFPRSPGECQWDTTWRFPYLKRVAYVPIDFNCNGYDLLEHIFSQFPNLEGISLCCSSLPSPPLLCRFPCNEKLVSVSILCHGYREWYKAGYGDAIVNEFVHAVWRKLNSRLRDFGLIFVRDIGYSDEDLDSYVKLWNFEDAPCSRLDSLELNGVNLDDEAIEKLAHLISPTLQSRDISRCANTSTQMPSLGSWQKLLRKVGKRLTALHLADFPLPVQMPKIIADECEKLAELTLITENMAELETIYMFKKLGNTLEYIDIECVDLSSTVLNTLFLHSKPRELMLDAVEARLDITKIDKAPPATFFERLENLALNEFEIQGPLIAAVRDYGQCMARWMISDHPRLPTSMVEQVLEIKPKLEFYLCNPYEHLSGRENLLNRAR